MRPLLFMAAAVLVPASGAAQEADGPTVVRLRCGKHVTGTVRIDAAKDPNGFWIEPWDTGGKVFVAWTQVTEFEKRRLLDKPVAAAVAGSLLDGVRVITTSNRYLLGVLVDGEGNPVSPIPASRELLPSIVRIKTRDHAAPQLVPRNAILSFERMRVPERDAYAPLEMVERRRKDVPDSDAAKLIELAQFARTLQLYEKARELYQKAEAAAPDRKAEIGRVMAQLEALLLERKAREGLAEVEKLSREGRFDKAIESAEGLLREYADTETMKRNRDLPEKLRKEREEYAKNRSAFLAKKVPEEWRAVRSSLLRDYAQSKYSLSDARAKVEALDPELAGRLAKRFACSSEDVIAAWNKREEKKRTVGMQDGTWLYRPGGNGGELDYQDTGAAGGKTEEDGAVDDFVRRFGGKKKGDKKKKEADSVGKKLQTADEWWSSAGSGRRRQWLETLYGLTSSSVKRIGEPLEKKCSRCRGEKKISASRGGKRVKVTCPRCHGGGVDLSVTYD